MHAYSQIHCGLKICYTCAIVSKKNLIMRDFHYEHLRMFKLSLTFSTVHYREHTETKNNPFKKLTYDLDVKLLKTYSSMVQL